MTRSAPSRRVVVALALALAPGAAMSVPAIRMSTTEAAEGARLINAYRKSRGLAPLRVDPQLSAAASQYARDMATTGLLTHDIGEPFATRMGRLGVPTASENIGRGYRTVAEAVEAWKASPAHDANLVKPHARMGLGRAEIPNTGNPCWVLILAP